MTAVLHPHGRGAPALITGGAGFVGTNLADRLARAGRTVIVLDNLSRPGVADNLRWLTAEHGERIQPIVAEVGDRAVLAAAVARAGIVFHLAAQVAVTHSLTDPLADFRCNAAATLELLEAVRRAGTGAGVIFTSTNKVYGAIGDLPLETRPLRYVPAAGSAWAEGIGEDRPLDFHSPYGCSKGAADQYVTDYARSFGLPTLVLRMSCIYGPHQHGTEDQGWVAHFLRQALAGAPLVIYGDGRQVRDVLYVDDLVDAFLLAEQHLPRLAGSAFNIGGGPQRTLSLLELLRLIAALDGRAPPVRYEPWRIGDQRVYVSDTRRFRAATGWQPRVGVVDGVGRLYRWLAARAPRRPIEEVA
jgi:CDP-paratose 2-epimerase